MLKNYAHAYLLLLWLFDSAMLGLSLASAYALRFFVLAPLFPDVPHEAARVIVTFELFLMAVPIWTLCFYVTGLYTPRRTERRTIEVFILAKATGLATLLLVFSQYFSGNDRYSRGVILLFTVVSFVLLAATRLVARRVLASVRARGFNGRRAVVVGVNGLSESLIERLNGHPEYGIRVCAILGASREQLGQELCGHRITGTYADLTDVLAATRADQVYLALSAAEHEELAQIHQVLATEMVDVRVVPDLLAFVTLRGGVEEMDGLPLVHLQSGPLVGIDAWLKRAFDLAITSVAIVVLSPVLLLCAALVKLSSPGPILYRQERMGLDGRVFEILKFRSMPVDAEAKTGAVWAKAGENRAFRFGAFMRKYSLDELPQLFNVLLGDMSLVGPRPERPVFIHEFKQRIPRYNLRHKIKAGITGLAQVEGWRGNTSIEKRIECDLRYIENWSLWLDVKILVRTGLGGFLSRNAY